MDLIDIGWAILDKDNNVVREKDSLSAAKWMEMNTEKRIVGKDEVRGQRISTVFLCLNHGFGGKDLWFETMIFDGDNDGWQDRYETYSEALAGHRRVVSQLTKGLTPGTEDLE